MAKRAGRARRRSGGVKLVQEQSADQPLTHCRWCRKPLAGIPVGRFYVGVCDDWQCPLYRERQGIREKWQSIDGYQPVILPVE